MSVRAYSHFRFNTKSQSDVFARHVPTAQADGHRDVYVAEEMQDNLIDQVGGEVPQFSVPVWQGLVGMQGLPFEQAAQFPPLQKYAGCVPQAMPSTAGVP